MQTNIFGFNVWVSQMVFETYFQIIIANIFSQSLMPGFIYLSVLDYFHCYGQIIAVFSAASLNICLFDCFWEMLKVGVGRILTNLYFKSVWLSCPFYFVLHHVNPCIDVSALSKLHIVRTLYSKPFSLIIRS